HHHQQFHEGESRNSCACIHLDRLLVTDFTPGQPARVHGRTLGAQSLGGTVVQGHLHDVFHEDRRVGAAVQTDAGHYREVSSHVQLVGIVEQPIGSDVEKG